ncbi:MAG: UDP-4-amino-4,6-dideoxy-N-acetyl-beta-L-altrosamine N-acetyltransferase [Lachnospiraceae bacterium]|nr:UDP-4-amino-4,6-dideoxy-N-acetyl-beta-L-altrosamine N-acetyltransferase [Lachnospiraceae bacterium]
MNIKLRRLVESDLERVMEWRMKPEVTKWMYTDPKLTMEKQISWYNSIKTSQDDMYWIIEVDNTPVGLMNIKHIDYKDSKCSWGYYVGEQKYKSLKLALTLEWNLYDYVFDVLKLNYLNNEVLGINKGVIALHKQCGSRVVGVDESAVEKNGEKYDVVNMTISKTEWMTRRDKITYEKVVFED